MDDKLDGSEPIELLNLKNDEKADDLGNGAEPIELLNMNHDEKADELGELSRGSDCRFFLYITYRRPTYNTCH